MYKESALYNCIFATIAREYKLSKSKNSPYRNKAS